MTRDSAVDDAFEYAEEYYANERIQGDLELIAKYRPEIVEGYLTLRQGIFKEPGEGGALDAKVKELIILGIECALRKTNPAPTFHARKAVESGATLDEIAEAVGLAIMLSGMMSYMESGRFVLKTAEERAAELADGDQEG